MLATRDLRLAAAAPAAGTRGRAAARGNRCAAARRCARDGAARSDGIARDRDRGRAARAKRRRSRSALPQPARPADDGQRSGLDLGEQPAVRCRARATRAVISGSMFSTSPKPAPGGSRRSRRARAARGRCSAGVVVVFTPAWEPPLLELRDFLAELRQRIGPAALDRRSAGARRPARSDRGRARDVAARDRAARRSARSTSRRAPHERPRFAIVGHPNKGKSSIVATLAEDDAVAISPHPGTTTQARTYPMRLDGNVLYELIDTPGFQRAREVTRVARSARPWRGRAQRRRRRIPASARERRALSRRVRATDADRRGRGHSLRRRRQPPLRPAIRGRDGDPALDRQAADGADQHDRRRAITSSSGARRSGSIFRSCACSTPCARTSANASSSCARSARSTSAGPRR